MILARRANDISAVHPEYTTGNSERSDTASTDTSQIINGWLSVLTSPGMCSGYRDCLSPGFYS